MELIAEVDGRRIYNDSTSTTPESTIAALESLDCRTFLIAGGRDKGLDFTKMLGWRTGFLTGAAFYGEIGQKLLKMTEASNDVIVAIAVPTLDTALDWCWEQSEPGDAIVLSPGCSSHDQFRNFRERGQRFAQLVARLAKDMA
jgi:UDP-N-acetylmuramoylalanine--D-glutamate ligase